MEEKIKDIKIVFAVSVYYKRVSFCFKEVIKVLFNDSTISNYANHSLQIRQGAKFCKKDYEGSGR